MPICPEETSYVVSFAEGYSDVLDDKKNTWLYDFLQPIWRGYIRGGGGDGAIHETLQYAILVYFTISVPLQ